MTDSEKSLVTTRKRLLYRSWHRGTREMDLLLGRFAECNLPTFSARQVELYEALLEYGDNDLYVLNGMNEFLEKISGVAGPESASVVRKLKR